MVRSDARILVNADSTINDATDAALELLGLDLEELRALPSGALSLEEDIDAAAGFDAAWMASGREPIFGSGTLRLRDSRLVRVRYLITVQPDGGYDVVLEPSDESVTDPPRMYTVGEALAKWRAAERKLAAVDAAGSEWGTVQAEFEHFRREYHRLANDQPPRPVEADRQS